MAVMVSRLLGLLVLVTIALAHPALAYSGGPQTQAITMAADCHDLASKGHGKAPDSSAEKSSCVLGCFVQIFGTPTPPVRTVVRVVHSLDLLHESHGAQVEVATPPPRFSVDDI